MGGVGYLRAPGTMASLASCLLLWAIMAWITPTAQNAVLAGGLILCSGLSIWAGRWAAVHFGDQDPGPFVLDEGAGICLTMILLPGLAGKALAIRLACAFCAFRLFDISKPPPARQLEKLPWGWGILMDDLAAAVYANLTCQLLLRWGLPRLGVGGF